jgi:hypothetical protein
MFCRYFAFVAGYLYSRAPLSLCHITLFDGFVCLFDVRGQWVGVMVDFSDPAK